MDQAQQTELEAAVYRQLRDHLRTRTDVQNIDLMILSGFCRNCLSKWYKAAAEEMGLDMDYTTAQEIVYGMPYSEWKEKHQHKATPEQLAAYEEQQKKYGSAAS